MHKGKNFHMDLVKFSQNNIGREMENSEKY